MNRFTKPIIALAIGAALVPAFKVQAQTVPVNLWNFNAASGTITPRPSTLQIPCGNIVGGCNASSGAVTALTGTAGQINVSAATGTVTLSTPQGISTTSSPTFAGVTSSGNTTSTSFTTGTSSSTSLITGLNKNIYIPDQNFLNALGCPGFPSDTSLDGCVNDWYGYYFGRASSTDFYLSQTASGTPYSIPDPAGFAFTHAGEYASLHCVAGRGTRINVTAATGTIGTIDWGTGNTAGAGVYGCAFSMANTVATTASTTGNVGWVVNSPYITFRDNYFNQGSVQIYLNTNTYLNSLSNNYFSFAGYAEVYAPNSNNSGESNTLTDNTFATMGNSTTSHAVYLNTESTQISGKSNDGAQIECGPLAHVSVVNMHHETINENTVYGSYYPIRVDAGCVYTEVNGDFQNDGVGASSSVAYIYDSGNVKEINPTLWANPSSTANFITVNAGASLPVVIGMDITNSPGTAQVVSVFPAGLGFPTSSAVSVLPASDTVVGSNYAGTISIGTSTNQGTATIMFSPAWNNTPVCSGIPMGQGMINQGNFVRQTIVSTTTLTLRDTIAYATNTGTGSQLQYWCFGNPN